MTLSQLIKIAPITLALLLLIVAIFVWQAWLGVSIENPTAEDVVRFGGNFLPLTVSEPYRLITAGFIHIGLMHLLFNGFALYFFGRVCEQLLGRWRYLAVFLTAVFLGNLTSLGVAWYQFLQGNQGFAVGAGASGGIMGLGALLLVLSLSRHPVANYLDKKNLLIVMAINLSLGFFVSGIDNGAHLGGALSGVIFALCLLYSSKLFVPTLIFQLVLVAMGWYALNQAVLPHLSYAL